MYPILAMEGSLPPEDLSPSGGLKHFNASALLKPSVVPLHAPLDFFHFLCALFINCGRLAVQPEGLSGGAEAIAGDVQVGASDAVGRRVREGAGAFLFARASRSNTQRTPLEMLFDWKTAGVATYILEIRLMVRET